MGASTAYTNLFNGSGMVYVTGPSGVFPAPVGERNYYSYPDLAFLNTPENAEAIKVWATLNTPENASGYASFQIEITNAAADNCTSVLVNGVGQTAGSVAMTVGDTTASAASIAAAISAHVPGAGPNYRAVNIGPLIIGLSDIIGTGTNGDIVLPAFSGASTATSTDVGGGRDSGVGLVRVFIDSSAGASETVMAGSAIEITEWVGYRGLQSGRLVTSASVVASAVQFERSSQDMTVVLGNNATLTNVVSLGVLDGDRITLQGNGADTQVVTASATIGLASSAAYTLTGADTKITLEWDATGSSWNELSRSSVADATQIRAAGVAVPLQAGVFQLSPAGGTMTITPGDTGVSAFPGRVYEHDVSVTAAAALGGALNFSVDTTDALAGDKGSISGNGFAITAFPVNFSDNTGVRATLTTEIAASGKWTVFWVVNKVAGANRVSFSLAPDFSTTNTGFVIEGMIKDANVTNVKLASGIDGAKLSAGTVPETALATTVQSKLNRVAPTVVNTALILYAASDGEIVFSEVSAGNVQISIQGATNPGTIIEVCLIDPLGTGNTVTIQDVDGLLISTPALPGALTYVLANPYEAVRLVCNQLEWVAFSIVV